MHLSMQANPNDLTNMVLISNQWQTIAALEKNNALLEQIRRQMLTPG
jgi:hypothetical protein